MKIECILHRPEGTIVEMPGKKYHFAPQDDGRHIANVTIDAHIERFLAIPEAYRIARSPGAAAAESDATSLLRATANIPDAQPQPAVLGEGETLLGSTEHPDSFEINGNTYAIGDVLLRAFQDSGLTVENWNELADEQRATKVDIVLDGIEAGEITMPPAQPATDERAALIAEFTAKFGKAPAANIKVETLKAKIAEAQG